MRELARFIVRGRFQAIGIVSLFGACGSLSLVLFPFSLLSAAAVGLVALRKDWLEGLVVLLAAGVIILVVFAMGAAIPGIMFPLVFAVLIPVFACVLILRRTASQDLVLLTVGLFSAAFVIAMHMSVGDVVAWWEDWLTGGIEEVKGTTWEEFERPATLRLMNGMAAMLLGMSTMASVLLSRWWQALLYYPGGFSKEFRGLHLAKLVLPGTVAILLVANTIDRVLLADLFMVAMMMYFFQGLAVIHGITAQRNRSSWWIAPIYIGLFVLPQFLITGLALVGAIDSVVRLRPADPKM